MNISTERIRPDEQSDSRQIIPVFIYLIILSFIIRLPFFFPIVIDWDESTYILWGQSVLDGHLPYTELWGFKPPLAFLFYAGAIGLFGKSIVAVRIAGTLCVALTAIFTYIAGASLWNHRTGIIGATLCSVLLSLLDSGQATMTEHVALVPLVGAFILLVRGSPAPRIFFSAGILMALATLVRLNLAYVAVLVGLFIVISVFAEPPRSIGKSLKCGIAYAAGGCLIVLLIFIPYAITDNQNLLWASVITASLSYAGSQLSFMGALKSQAMHIFSLLHDLKDPRLGINILVWFGGLAGIVIIVSQWTKSSKPVRLGTILLMVFLLSIELSILKGGAIYEHYLIQLVPFMALATAVFLNTFFLGNARWLIIGIISIALITSTLLIIPEYKKMVSRALSGQPLIYGAAYDIAAYLKQNNPSGEPIYMMTDHIVYWLINAKPLSKSTTHPSNIAKEYLLNVLVGPGTTTKMELASVLSKKPRYIVFKGPFPWYLRNDPAARFFLDENLKTHYVLVNRIEGRQIFRRKQ
jgi:4-amino-4-deoxy-L-arabinose transferase-like glycosyltransferase